MEINNTTIFVKSNSSIKFESIEFNCFRNQGACLERKKSITNEKIAFLTNVLYSSVYTEALLIVKFSIIIFIFTKNQ